MGERKTAHATFTIERVYPATPARIVPNERAIYGYDMHISETRISVSLATVELKPEGKGTCLVFTDQAVFLDDFDDGGGRERGSGVLLDHLGAALALE